MSKRRGVANMRWRSVPLSGCKRYLKGLKSAEEGRYDINTQMERR